MDTALKTNEEKKEYFDSDEVLDKKILELAQMIKNAKHFIVFTGAGISTGAGVRDFRSGIDTVLPTGPGAWEKLAQKDLSKPKANVNTLKAIPTPTHMALVKLQQVGLLKFLISQNTDGLHRRSGFPPEKLAELHGNSNLEKCQKPDCLKEYFRDFGVRISYKARTHETNRFCECGAPLYDSIIDFGEMLPKKAINDGYEQSAEADLCLCLGSSLRVSPAADMPVETTRKGGKLVIVNLQKTPIDDRGIVIHGMIDTVMTKLMLKLNIEIPKFILKRRIAVKYIEEWCGQTKKKGLRFRGMDNNGTDITLFTRVAISLPGSKEIFVTDDEPFTLFPKSICQFGVVKAKFGFRGHYGEPLLAMEIPISALKLDSELLYALDYDPSMGQWIKNKM
jgi:NAD-dependent SIR2 family protein deacetylase